MNQNLLKIIKGLFLSLVIGTPLAMSPITSELFEFNKMLWIYMMTGGILSTWIALMIVSQKIIIKKTVLDIPIFAILITGIVSTIFSIDTHTSLFGYYGRFDGGLLSLFSFALLYYAYISTIGFDKAFRILLLKSAVVMGAVVVLLGIPGLFGRDLICGLFTGTFSNACWTDAFRPAERMFSTLGQPNWLGAYLSIMIPLSLSFLIQSMKEKNRYTPLFYGVLIHVQFFGLLMTRSRSALAAGLIAILGMLIILYMQPSIRTSILKAKKYFGLLVVGFICIILLFGTGVAKIDRFAHIPTILKSTNQTTPSDNTSANDPLIHVTASTDIRKVVWRGAFDLFKKYPVFGVGLDTFGYGYYFTRPVEHNYTSEWDYLYNRAHNEYLNQLATTGLLGFTAQIFFLLMCGFTIWKTLGKNKGSDEDYGLIAALAMSWMTILITNFFGFFTTSIHFFYFLIPAMIVSSQMNYASYSESSSWRKRAWLLVLPVVSVIFVCIFSLTYFLADTSYAQAKNQMTISNYPEAAKLMRTALSMRKEHVYQDTLAFTEANTALLLMSSDETKSKEAESLLLNSFDLNRETLKASPHNLLYYRTGAKLGVIAYQLTRDEKYVKQSIAFLDEASKIAPTEPKVPYSKGLYYSFFSESAASQALKKEYAQEGILALDEAIALKKNYRDAYVLKANLYEMVGDVKSAKEVYETILKTINKNDKEAKDKLEKLK